MRPYVALKRRRLASIVPKKAAPTGAQHGNDAQLGRPAVMLLCDTGDKAAPRMGSNQLCKNHHNRDRAAVPGHDRRMSAFRIPFAFRR
eukprot:scaffold58_cov256-Pinguiococcus_pyrenoidosus.AAC.32